MAPPLGSGHSNENRGPAAQLVARPKYTKSPDSSGWLRIKLEPSGEFAFLCEFIKVIVVKENSRTFFSILEGVHKGKIGSLTKENASKCLVESARGSGAKLTATVSGRKKLISAPRQDDRELNQLLAELEFDGKSSTITLDSDVNFEETNPLSPNYGKTVHSKPLPAGTYKILAPESAKKSNLTAFYATNPGGYPDLKYHTVWFPIENPATQNSNFVHVGNLSEGCVTMYQLEMWNPLYLYLISNRMDKDGKYVGTVTIK